MPQNYRKAPAQDDLEPPRSCSNCRYFNHNRCREFCTRYFAVVSVFFVCDDWESKRRRRGSEPTPPTRPSPSS